MTERSSRRAVFADAHPAWRPDEPERFDFSLLVSPVMQQAWALLSELTGARHSTRRDSRALVPGLRQRGAAWPVSTRCNYPRRRFMAEKTGIAWTDSTFNPWRGCTRVSPGCTHCYAATFSVRNPSVLDAGATRARACWPAMEPGGNRCGGTAAEKAGVRRRAAPRSPTCSSRGAANSPTRWNCRCGTQSSGKRWGCP